MKLIEAVQSALVLAFRISEGDRDIVLDLYDPSRRIVSSGRSERYTRVEIVGISARSDEAKRKLFAAIVNNLELLGVPRSDVRIFVIEAPASHWGVNGGVPASDVDLGFKVDV